MKGTSQTKGNEAQKSMELKALIFDLLQLYGDPMDAYLWPWEEARWHELVFCLAIQVAPPELTYGEIERMIGTLADIGLINPQSLTECAKDGKKPDLSSPDLALIQEVLKRYEMSAEKAADLVVTICEAAAGFQSVYQGRVQRFLRKYGRMMLEDLENSLSFSKLEDKAANAALSQWLQNVACMPIALSEDELKEVCEGLETTPDDLVDVVDELNLNLSMVDDLLISWMDSERMLAESDGAE